MSIMEDQLFEREAAMNAHIENDEANNRAIIEYLGTRIDHVALESVRAALASGGNQTFDFGQRKVGLGYDGHYHVFERGSDGKFFEVDLPNETNEAQRAA